MDRRRRSTERNFFLPLSPATRKVNAIRERSSQWGQLAIVLISQVCDVLASQSVQPYINHLVGELDIIEGDERKVGYYVGLLGSSADVTGTLTVLFWNRLSDQIGRKPVLLFGTAGSIVSLLCFGLSKSFSGLVLSRCLWGLLNGNIGVVKTVIGEVADSSSRPQAFALLSSMWTVGASIGSVIGGSLARPNERFRSLFAGSFWKKYPYFLPCLVVSIITGLKFFLVLLSFNETVSRKLQTASNGAELDDLSEPLITSTTSPPPRYPLFQLLTRPVVIAVINFSFLEFLTSCHVVFTPFFLAMPIEIGGVGFDPVRIGYVMSSLRIFDALFVSIFCTSIVRSLGERRTFIFGMASFLILWALFPMINLCAKRIGVSPAVWGGIVLLVVPMICMDLAYTCIYMFVTATAPSKRSLGVINGFAQTVVAVPIMMGGIMAPALFSLTVELQLMDGYAVYVIFCAISCIGVCLASMLPNCARPKWELEGDWDEE